MRCPVTLSLHGTPVVSGSSDILVQIWDTITGESILFPEYESFGFQDACHLRHLRPGQFQLFAHTAGSISSDKKWILNDQPSPDCWYLKNSATSTRMLSLIPKHALVVILARPYASLMTRFVIFLELLYPLSIITNHLRRNQNTGCTSTFVML